MLSFLIPLAFPDRQPLNVFKEKLECGGSREGGERIREKVINFFSVFVVKRECLLACFTLEVKSYKKVHVEVMSR